MSGRWRVAAERVALVAAGVLLETLAQPPGPAPVLVFVQDVPFLLLLWHRGGARWKRWVFAYGFLRFAIGLRWLVNVHPAMPFGAAAVLGALWLGVAVLLRWLVARRIPFLLAVPVATALGELAQTVVQGSSGMPWPARSLAFGAFEAWTAAASILGAYGLSALAATTSAWASGLASLGRRDGFRVERARALIGSGLVLAALLGVVAWRGALRVSATDARLAAGDAFLTAPVVVVQANVDQSLKNDRRRERSAQQILESHVRLTTEALLELVDRRRAPLCVIWPETMIPWPFTSPALARRFPDAAESERNVMGHLAACVPPGMSVPFLVGANYYVEGRTGPHDALLDHDSLDSYFLVDVDRLPEGAPADGSKPWIVRDGRHDKELLVPWGEYTPGGSWIPGIRTLRGAISIIPELTPGDGTAPPFPLATMPPRSPGYANREIRAGTIVCFEIAFPGACRAWRARGANVLVNPGNYAWYGDSGMPAQVLALGKLRAAETASALVIAGNTGPSAILDPAGRLTARCERGGRTQYVEGVCVGPLLVDPGYRTLYAIVGDVPLLVSGVLLVLLGALRGRRRGSLGGGPSGVGAASGDTSVTEEMGSTGRSEAPEAASDPNRGSGPSTP